MIYISPKSVTIGLPRPNNNNGKSVAGVSEYKYSRLANDIRRVRYCPQSMCNHGVVEYINSGGDTESFPCAYCDKYKI